MVLEAGTHTLWLLRLLLLSKIHLVQEAYVLEVQIYVVVGFFSWTSVDRDAYDLLNYFTILFSLLRC